MCRPEKRVATLGEQCGVATIDDPILQGVHQCFGAHWAVAARLDPIDSWTRQLQHRATARRPEICEHSSQRGSNVADDGERGRGAEGHARHFGIDVDVDKAFGRDEAAVPE